MPRDIDADGVITSGRLKGSRTRPPSVHGGEREIVWHAPVPPTEVPVKSIGGHGEETRESHPAFGLINISRATVAGGTPGESGAVLFDSEMKHTEIIRLTVTQADRQRSLKKDWIHGVGPALIEVEMSMAQFAGAITSMNTSGVPCTVRQTETNGNVDGLDYAPRLALGMAEVREAADNAFAEIAAITARLAAMDSKTPAKERNAAIRDLENTVRNATPNVEHAANSLTRHAENVVQKAQADIEAMVVRHAEKIGLEPGQAPVFGIGGPSAQPAIEAGQ